MPNPKKIVWEEKAFLSRPSIHTQNTKTQEISLSINSAWVLPWIHQIKHFCVGRSDLSPTEISTLLIFSLQKLQVFTVSQIPLQFHCIFYRQPTVNIFLQFLHSIFALFVCKKCSETAVGFVTQWKPVLPLQILAVCAHGHDFVPP